MTEKMAERMADKQASSTQSIKRLFNVIETMASIGRPVRLQEIAEQCDASPSTIMRTLNAMIENGYANQDPETQFYSLSFKFLRIGNAIMENATINSLIHPYLYDITNSTGISSALAIKNGTTITYIDEVVSTSAMIRVHHHLGVPFPMYHTAAGKLFLSEMSPAELNQYFLNVTMSPLNKNTITTRAKMEEAIKEIREKGYAYNNEEAGEGLRCLAFPIRNESGELLATISLSGTVFSINDETKEDLIRTSKEIIDRLYEKCLPALSVLKREYPF